ncbi:MAG: glycosyltransferase [Rhodomicrobium sp.]
MILYNYAPEYIAGLLVLLAKRNRAFLDVEDAPLTGTFRFVEVFNRINYLITSLLCGQKYLTVSREVARNMRLSSAVVVYGAISQSDLTPGILPLQDDEIRVLYSGTLAPETGLEIFCDAVRLLSKMDLPKGNRIVFVVTGFGGEELLEKLRGELSSNTVRLEWLGALSYVDYQRAFSSCFAALCLKMPGSEVGSTTFPSKVVEITSRGLLLLSTPVSDIPLLFDSTSAILLKDATPDCLASAIVKVIGDPDYYRKIAARGLQRATEIFSEQCVGEKIKSLLFNGA